MRHVGNGASFHYWLIPDGGCGTSDGCMSVCVVRLIGDQQST